MMAMEVDGAREEGGADGWSGTLTDAVTKCGRDSDRRLYVYGISLNRCPKCQARLRSDNDTCASCHYTHKTPRKCLRCSQKNDPVMWCAECDAYFCAGCYKKPHVLMLGSTKPHHCFAIDGASGKHFVDSAWSDEFATMVQETYRRRLHDKMVAEETPAKAPTPEQQEQQAEPAVNGAPDQTAPASSAAATPPQHPAAESSSPATATSVTDGTAEVSTTFGSNGGSTQTSSSSDARTQEQSRKRQLPGPDDTRDRIQKALRSQESSRTAAAATAAPPDGNHHIVVRNPNVQRSQQQQQEQQPAFSEEMVPRAMSSGSGGFSPSKSGEDDELRAIWVSDYDKVNALIAQLDEEISKRNEEGHQFVHMSNNINIPEQLKLKIHQLRAQRDAAMKKRFESVVRVLIFSDAVRSFAQQNEHTNIWYDVPDALKASHKKCAELAASIEEFEGQAQKLRNGIDEAVSSGNPAQMQNVVHLGALIADLKRKIRASNAERDTQFIFMFQFSDTLRNMVRSEWAATGRGYHLQSSQ
ncbi:hypothetical protein PF005_g2716 [Phytophthora fragariae]|uniref:B box-type domain-containing protein n=1 Tax=Phytophthora fragariae TaxID=53985 RepID=A0A6A3TR70_9STRA|nr:hypothetical protein PF009_g2294 [Phytophthora fragariae]KAE9135320.1 hypothetical protein PF007_g2609 [Phytophthora fragariae]KAE9153721.1 hypothetical protein PF006_g2191 [Phytophthora fragariae]KAE9232507.1 hypothetical protein PF005_g2716 [Phytophthora fragariae]KAE9252177.1 hypothetical protein PF004_g2112 [Phytophthora fragariae]